MSQFAKSRTRTIGLYVHVIGYLSHIASQLSFQNSWYPGVCPSGGQCCIAIKFGCRISQHLTSAIDGQRIYAIRYHRADLPFPACCTTACEAAKHPNNRTCRPRAARVVRVSGILTQQDWKTPTMRAGSRPRNGSTFVTAIGRSTFGAPGHDRAYRQDGPEPSRYALGRPQRQPSLARLSSAPVAIDG